MNTYAGPGHSHQSGISDRVEIYFIPLAPDTGVVVLGCQWYGPRSNLNSLSGNIRHEDKHPAATI